MKNVFKLPISEQFSATGDSGRCVEAFIADDAMCVTRALVLCIRPFVLSGLSADEEQIYDTLATTVLFHANDSTNRCTDLTTCILGCKGTRRVEALSADGTGALVR